ncbi:MAG: PilZ domain-containing protein [Novosphingobium sp.]
MGEPKPREQRRSVFVTCRLRGDSGWSDVTICNLSDHGLMARCSDPPPKGAFIELRKGGVTIVGQVRWSRDQRIGVRTQDRIDMVSVLAESPAMGGDVKIDRRAFVRDAVAGPPKPTPAELAARSRRWSHRFNWLIIAAAGIVSAGIVAGQVHALLSAPLRQATVALGR